MPDLGLTWAESLKLLPEPVRRARLEMAQAIMTDKSSFDTRLRELVRLRSAAINGCRFCLATRTSELTDPLPEISDPETDQRLTDRERLALLYTDRFSLGADGVDDSFFERLRGAFSLPEIVELTHLIAYVGASQRVNAMFDVDPETGLNGVFDVVSADELPRLAEKMEHVAVTPG